MIPSEIEPATLRFIAQHLNHFATVSLCHCVKLTRNNKKNYHLLICFILLAETVVHISKVRT